ncbi:hypothetical protein JW930_04185 [Candidatus Woesearchaeota archaeon]|nr:hypothetical protein [Candidatus Woesearchaeota archaeon]
MVDLLPNNDIDKITDGLAKLKKGSGNEHETLVRSMNSLTGSINSLLGIFKEAAEDMKMDEHDSVLLGDRIDPIMEKLDKLLEQNEKIAKGIVALADMIDEMKGGKIVPAPPTTRQMPMQQSSYPQPRTLPKMPELPQDEKNKLFNINFK